MIRVVTDQPSDAATDGGSYDKAAVSEGGPAVSIEGRGPPAPAVTARAVAQEKFSLVEVSSGARRFLETGHCCIRPVM